MLTLFFRAGWNIDQFSVVYSCLLMVMLVCVKQGNAGEKAMYDDYSKSFYSEGPVTLKIGESYEFSSNARGTIAAKKYVLKLVSVDKNVARFDINGSSLRVEREYDHSYNTIAIKGIGYTEDSVTIVLASGT